MCPRAGTSQGGRPHTQASLPRPQGRPHAARHRLFFSVYGWFKRLCLCFAFLGEARPSAGLFLLRDRLLPLPRLRGSACLPRPVGGSPHPRTGGSAPYPSEAQGVCSPEGRQHTGRDSEPRGRRSSKANQNTHLRLIVRPDIYVHFQSQNNCVWM